MLKLLSVKATASTATADTNVEIYLTTLLNTWRGVIGLDRKTIPETCSHMLPYGNKFLVLLPAL